MPEIRERALKSLKNKYPDKEFAEDEDLMPHIVDYVDDLEGYKTKNTETNQKLYEVLDAEPELVLVIKDLIAGATLREALARHLDPQDLQPVEGDPDYEGWSKNREARLAKAEEGKKFNEELQANIDYSLTQAEEFAKDKGLSEEETNAFLDKVDEALKPILNGKVDKTFLENMYKALNYETALTEQRQLGEASALNQKIIAEKESESGDGLPKIEGGSDEVQVTPKKEGYIERLNKDKYR